MRSLQLNASGQMSEALLELQGSLEALWRVEGSPDARSYLQLTGHQAPTDTEEKELFDEIHELEAKLAKLDAVETQLREQMATATLEAATVHELAPDEAVLGSTDVAEAIMQLSLLAKEGRETCRAVDKENLEHGSSGHASAAKGAPMDVDVLLVDGL